ncbi:MAG: hypothetical protein IJ193_05635 [Bacilli bacterium]|nr:hypothetical protein [Bacilli bacterium]
MEKYNPVYVTTVMVCIFLFSFLSASGIFSKNKKDVDKKDDKTKIIEKNVENEEENEEENNK